jgi:hypothetical protein
MEFLKTGILNISSFPVFSIGFFDTINDWQ